MMKTNIIFNPFRKHQIHSCCGHDELRPFINYIYFIDGVAYATDAHVLLALSLSDILAEKALIDCLNGFKMHFSDMEMMNEFVTIYPERNGKIYLNDEYTRILQLQPLDYNDKEKEYLKIPEHYLKAKNEMITNIDAVSKIKISLHLLQKLGTALGFSNAPRFNFLKSPSRIYVEFEHYKNSFAIVMPIRDLDT